MKKSTLFITRTALLSAVAIVLSALEMLIPDFLIPLPGIKPGFSNIAVMFALLSLNLPCALFIAVIKAVFVLLMRGLVAFLMSLAGGLLSTLTMYLLIKVKKPQFGYFGIGVCGAFFHNFAQILVAFFMTDKTVFAYLPVLSLTAVLTGALTSFIVYIVIPALKRIKFDSV